MDSGQLLVEMSRRLELSPKNVPLSYCTVMDFGGFRTALSRNVKRVRVKSKECAIELQHSDGFW